ncbi:GNAT family N-acetyltransferase [Saccharopolyspora sp. NPDC050389]|uniref:GNAT family N-acetyltransferase n=1 Tax=Saccharopolyspora sp. NPDC050389 TaxID=3155516 RepID=UPI0033CFCF8E
MGRAPARPLARGPRHPADGRLRRRRPRPQPRFLRPAPCALRPAHRAPAPPRPRHSGLTGHVRLVATTAGFRRRGMATAVLTALVDWFDQQGCKVINLNATGEGERLYRAIGFTPWRSGPAPGGCSCPVRTGRRGSRASRTGGTGPAGPRR